MQIFILMTLVIMGCLPNPTWAEDHQYIAVQAGEPQGGIILRYPAVVETMANQLAYKLADFGWAILLVPIPDKMYSPKTSPTSNELVHYMTTEKGQFNLVVLAIGDTWDQDTGFDTVLNAGDPSASKPIQGIVLLDVPGEVPTPPQLPVLDVVTRNYAPDGWAARQKQARNRQANQQSLTLTHSTRPQQNESRLDRRIRGWLAHNVRGQELSEGDL